jgi:prolyl 4-hydroxylase
MRIPLFFIRYQTPVVRNIQDRVALLTKLPVLHQESIQVLRYGRGQYCHEHLDLLPGDEAGPRMATILIYLMDSEEGGEVRDCRLGVELKCEINAQLFEPHT